MKNITLIFTVLIFVMSCGEKAKTSSSFSISLGALTSGAPQNGGVIITGHKLDDSANIQLGFTPGENLTVELENGMWEFAAVSWVGVNGEMFTGDHNCAYVAPIDLKGGDININFNLSPNVCNNIIAGGERFSESSHFSSADPVQFRVLKIRSCIITPATISGTSCLIGTEVGLTKSYRLVYGDQSDGIVKSLSSSCYNIDDQNEDGETHNIAIPIGDSNGTIFSYKILAFTEDNCGGSVVNYSFDDGIYNGSFIENKNVFVDNTLNGEFTYLFLEHNPLSFSLSHNPLFGFGSLGEVINNTSVQLTVSDYARIKGINSADTRIITVDDTSMFSPHEELMWLSNEEGIGGGDCSDFIPGVYNTVRVRHIIDATTLELYTPINHYKLDDGSIDVLNIPTAGLLTSSTGGSSFCSMQFIKMYNYENFTIDGGGATNFVKPLAYDKANGVGGVLALRVKNKLETMGSNVTISADEKGRASSDTYSYSSCPIGKKCAYLGNSGGGGIIFISAANLDLGAGNTTLTSSGVANGAGAGGSGGSIILKSHSIDLVSATNLQFTASGGNGSTIGGEGGVVQYSFCLNASSIDGSFGVTDVNGGAGSPNGLNGSVFDDTSFCPL